jgi:hypothetical protein
MTHVLDRFIEPVTLAEHGFILGLIDIPGAGRRVATWDHYECRNMSAAAARRLANELEETEVADQVQPVIKNLRALADKAEAFAAQAEQDHGVTA